MKRGSSRAGQMAVPRRATSLTDRLIASLGNQRHEDEETMPSIPYAIPDELPDELPNELPEELPDEVPSVVPSAVPSSVPSRIVVPNAALDPIQELLEALEPKTHTAQQQRPQAEQVYDVRQEVLLRWRRSRTARFTVGKHTAFTMPHKPFLTRAHDSDVLIKDPVVLFPTPEKTHGARLYMAYDKLESDVNLVSVVPFTIHSLFGLRIFQKTVKLPDAEDKPKTFPKMFKKEKLALTAAGLDPNDWIHLQNLIGVYTEQKGVPLVKVYGIAVAKADYARFHQTITIKGRIADLKKNYDLQATQGILPDRQELYGLLEQYNKTVLETQTVFLVTPFMLARVPEAVLRARSFLVAELLPVHESEAFSREESTFRLPAQVTVVTHYDGIPVLHEGFLLGPVVPPDQVRNLLSIKSETERDTLGSGPVSFVSATDAVAEVERRRVFGPWANRTTYVVIEAGTSAWRSAIQALVETELMQNLVLISPNSFTETTQPTLPEARVYSAVFLITERFQVKNSRMTGPYVPQTNVTGFKDVCLLCNSCTLVVRTSSVVTPRSAAAGGVDLFASNILCVVADTVWEAIVHGWNRTDAGSLHVSISRNRRYAGPGSRIYYGPGLGRLVVVDREGTSKSLVSLTEDKTQKVRAELERVGILETRPLCILQTDLSTLVIADQYRVVITGGKVTVTRDMILADGVYIVSLAIGMLGSLNPKEVLETYKQRIDRHTNPATKEVTLDARELGAEFEYRALRDPNSEEHIHRSTDPARTHRVSEVDIDL